MRIGFNILFILNLLLLVSACKKDASIQVNMHYDYFPTNQGHWVIYDVDSIVYDDVYGTVDSFSFQIKEITDTTFEDLSGRKTQRLELYKRSSDSVNWEIQSVWTSNLTSSTAEKTEDNLRFIKLAFPVSLSQSWMGNSYINPPDNLDYLSGWEYQYANIHEPSTVNLLSFDSTLNIIGIADSSLIEKNYFQEKYAKNVGLIFKHWEHLEKCITDTCNPFGPWEKGFIYVQSVNSYSSQ